MEYTKTFILTDQEFEDKYQSNDWWIEKEYIAELEELHPDMEPGTLHATFDKTDGGIVYKITIGLIPK
jgi:hypothetical protein